MRHFKRILAIILLFMGQYNCFAQNVSSSLQYTGNEPYIKQKVAKMLVSNTSSDNNEALKRRDPNTYWLLNRMMTMLNTVSGDDDNWAWTIATNECIKQYNSRIGRKNGSAKQAMQAIENLIQTLFDEGIAYDMNTGSKMLISIERYKTFNNYLETINNIQGCCKNAHQIQALYYNECKIWNSLNSIANALAQSGIEGSYLRSNGMLPASTFSILTSIIDSNTITRYKERAEKLELEKSIFTNLFVSSKYEGKYISDYEFGQLLNSFTALSSDISNLAKEYAISDPQNFMIGNMRNSAEQIIKCTNAYRNKLLAWCDIRNQIASSLPQEKQASYRETTKRMYAALYKDLKEILDTEM